MKKFVSALSLVLLAAILGVTLVSCGMSGAYKSAEFLGSYTKYTFKGSKVTVDIYMLGEKSDESFTGRFKIKDEDITFTWKNADGERKTATYSFKQIDENTVKIGGISYTKE